MPGLGWIPHPDARNRDFPMRSVLRLSSVLAPAPPEAAAGAEITRRYGPPIDQGNTPMCVGFTGENLQLAGPVMTKPVAGLVHGPQVYALCKQVDGHPTEDGSTTNALMAVLRQLGFISGWYWATERLGRPMSEDVREWLLAYGCVAMGSWWRGGMEEPAPPHYRLSYSGAIRGGHEYAIVGYDADLDEFIMKNSWGETWADRGLARFPRAELDKALVDGGEAAGVIEIRPRPRRP